MKASSWTRTYRGIRRILIYSILFVACLCIAGILIGGGFGGKPPLPEPFVELRRPIYFAHRVAVGGFPENSLGGIAEARRLGFAAAELDVRAVRGGELVVFHDANTDRLLGYQSDISSLTSKELKSRPLMHADSLTSELVPTLREAIAGSGDLLLYLDVKHGGSLSDLDLARAFARVIEEINVHDRVSVASHRILFIAYLEYMYPNIVTILQDVNPNRTTYLPYIPTKFRPDMIASRYASITPEFRAWLDETGMIHRYITYHLDASALQNAVQSGIEMLMVTSLTNVPR